ncbi:hypothetical protein WJX81_005351 [Elliptochloris bilobata]|uniref:N-alpha-acetyltransferase 40 n=1 Tax=Elliptochloris bilobata TaxID=381761 RepID=A0AAW1SE03_9CHLO
MGKKSSRGKEKKQSVKAETEKLRQERQAVLDLLNKANAAPDLMAAYPAFRRYDRNGLAAALVSCGVGGLPPGDAPWAFALCKANMQALYDTAWGWDDASKRDELAATEARFIVVYTQAQEGGERQPAAYVHYRWEEEDGRPVLYCYEIQLEPRVQRRGLGGFLMKLLELAARKVGVDALMLTVIDANVGARAMYTKLGYLEHESSPTEEEAAGYGILARRLTAYAAAAAPLRPVTNSYQLEQLIFS